MNKYILLKFTMLSITNELFVSFGCSDIICNKIINYLHILLGVLFLMYFIEDGIDRLFYS